MGALTILLAAAGAASAPAATAQAATVRVEFDARRIGAVQARGLADRATGRAATADDPVRIASVSKLVVALGVMRMVEAGTLDLDADVSRTLGWELRNPNSNDVPITLRMLLSHTAGLRDDGEGYVIPLEGSLRAAVARPAAWDSEHRTGSWFHYSNLNFGVIGSVMEAASGERFDTLIARLVLKPLKLDACFNWTTCSDVKAARAVVLYGADGSVRRDDLKGARPACPVNASGPCNLSTYKFASNGALFSPQGGLRISARDLARIGQMLLRRGEDFLKPASVAAMTRPHWVFDGDNGDTDNGFYCAYGLAVQLTALARPGTPAVECHDDVFGDGRPRFGHAGEAYGLRSGLWIDPNAKRGVAYFTTAVADDAPKGRSAYTAAEEALARGN